MMIFHSYVSLPKDISYDIDPISYSIKNLGSSWIWPILPCMTYDIDVEHALHLKNSHPHVVRQGRKNCFFPGTWRSKRAAAAPSNLTTVVQMSTICTIHGHSKCIPWPWGPEDPQPPVLWIFLLEDSAMPPCPN